MSHGGLAVTRTNRSLSVGCGRGKKVPEDWPQSPAHTALAPFGEGDLLRAVGHTSTRLSTRTRKVSTPTLVWSSVISAVSQRKLAFTIAQRAAAFNAHHLHLPGRRCRLDALDQILGITVRATERFSHGWTIARAARACADRTPPAGRCPPEWKIAGIDLSWVSGLTTVRPPLEQ